VRAEESMAGFDPVEEGRHVGNAEIAVVLAKNTPSNLRSPSVVSRLFTSSPVRQNSVSNRLFLVPMSRIVASATGIELCLNPAVWVTTSRRFTGAGAGAGVVGAGVGVVGGVADPGPGDPPQAHDAAAASTARTCTARLLPGVMAPAFYA
jgi:hypothetical protein